MRTSIAELRSLIADTYRRTRVVDTSPRTDDDRAPMQGSIARGLARQETDVQDEIEELAASPEFASTDAFIAHKLDNEQYTYDFIELQALARNGARKRTGDDRVVEPSRTDLDAVRHELEAGMGFRYVARQPVKQVRGHLSSAHGTHPFAGSGAGGSGFGSDFSGGSFTSFGGGPGAVGGGYEWNPDDPKNLPMGSRRRKR